MLKQNSPAKLVEVDSTSKSGKTKMRQLVDWSIRQLVDPGPDSLPYSVKSLTSSATAKRSQRDEALLASSTFPNGFYQDRWFNLLSRVLA